jgi:hypothetical protein
VLIMTNSEIEKLVDEWKSSKLPSMGTNRRRMLTEMAIRLGIPADSIAVVLVTGKKQGQPAHTKNIYLWGAYSEDRLEFLKAHPLRRWNQTVKANTFAVDNDDQTLDLLDALKSKYSRIVVIRPDSYEVFVGDAPEEWTDMPLYQLLDKPQWVHLRDVCEEYKHRDPNYLPNRMAIHSEVDSDFRSIFNLGVGVNIEDVIEVEFPTRHPLLVARFSVAVGRPRYFVYDVSGQNDSQVLYPLSKKLRVLLARLKMTQLQLRHPVIGS